MCYIATGSDLDQFSRSLCKRFNSCCVARIVIACHCQQDFTHCWGLRNPSKLRPLLHLPVNSSTVRFWAGATVKFDGDWSFPFMPLNRLQRWACTVNYCSTAHQGKNRRQIRTVDGLTKGLNQKDLELKNQCFHLIFSFDMRDHKRS